MYFTHIYLYIFWVVGGVGVRFFLGLVLADWYSVYLITFSSLYFWEGERGMGPHLLPF